MAIAPPPVKDLDWSPERAETLATRAVGLWKEFLHKLPTLPVSRRWRDIRVASHLELAIPDEPTSEGALVDHLRKIMFDGSIYPGSPRFMAFITGAGTVPGAVADLLAAALNQNVGVWRLAPAATEIEQFLGRWFAKAFGLPPSAGGLVVTGGAMANFVALKAARDAKAGWNIRDAGVRDRPQLAMYASEEAHHVIERAADMLGLGATAVRKIAVDGGGRMRIELLEAAIADDRARGVRPIAVVATAGTVAIGAIDPMPEIAAICQREQLWFHVDGAYGALATLAPELAPLFAGMEQADSIAFDPHKWLYTPHSGGFVLVRDLQHLANAFSLKPTYVREDKELTGNGLDTSMLGPQFSRGFAALKIWVSLLAHGRAAYARRISHDVALARYLDACVRERPELESMCEVTLSIACFRYVPPDLGELPDRDTYLDKLNEVLMAEIQMDGRAFCSNAVLGPRYVLRACIVNFRTEAPDIDILLDTVIELGAKLDRTMRPRT